MPHFPLAIVSYRLFPLRPPYGVQRLQTSHADLSDWHASTPQGAYQHALGHHRLTAAADWPSRTRPGPQEVVEVVEVVEMDGGSAGVFDLAQQGRSHRLSRSPRDLLAAQRVI